MVLLRRKRRDTQEQKQGMQDFQHKLLIWVYAHNQHTCKWLIQFKYLKVSLSVLFIKFMIFDYSTILEYCRIHSIFHFLVNFDQNKKKIRQNADSWFFRFWSIWPTKRECTGHQYSIYLVYQPFWMFIVQIFHPVLKGFHFCLGYGKIVCHGIILWNK